MAKAELHINVNYIMVQTGQSFLFTKDENVSALVKSLEINISIFFYTEYRKLPPRSWIGNKSIDRSLTTYISFWGITGQTADILNRYQR